MTWVTLHHLVGWFKASVGDLSNRELLMVCFLCRDDWSVGSEGEVNTWVGYQVSLELSQIHIESSIKTQGCSDRTYNLTNQPRKRRNSCIMVM